MRNARCRLDRGQIRGDDQGVNVMESVASRRTRKAVRGARRWQLWVPPHRNVLQFARERCPRALVRQRKLATTTVARLAPIRCQPLAEFVLSQSRIPFQWCCKFDLRALEGNAEMGLIGTFNDSNFADHSGRSQKCVTTVAMTRQLSSAAKAARSLTTIDTFSLLRRIQWRQMKSADRCQPDFRRRGRKHVIRVMCLMNA